MDDEPVLAPSLEAAARWARATFDDDDRLLAWELTDPDLRLARVQLWFGNTGRSDRRHMAAAAELASRGPAHPRWAAFDDWSTHLRRSQLGGFFESPWGVYEHVDVVGLDLEAAVLARTDGTTLWVDHRRPFRAQVVIMRYSNRWRVAGLGRSVAVPGWPPTGRTVRLPQH